jgi:hypothetical protein
MDLELNQEYTFSLPNCIIHYCFIFNKSFDSFQLLFRIMDPKEGSPVVNLKKIRTLLGDEFLEGITMTEHPANGLIYLALHICTFRDLANELRLDNSLDSYLALYNHHPLVRLVRSERKKFN